MKIRNIRKFLFSITTLLWASSSLGQTSAACEALQNFSQGNLEITSSIWARNRSVQAGPFAPPVTLPAHCHVEGVMDKRVGVNNVEYSIGFALNLPENWNGRFLFQGGGGLNGNIGEPVGGQATGGISALDKGFAVASTDSGHQGGIFDAGFMADQEAMLNFYYLANARVTEVTKQLTNEFYANEIDKSYFVGCSTGGREAMIMSQRFPFYFDGIVSGAPAMRTGLSNLADNWVAVELNKAAQKDAQGLPVAGGTFNKAEQTLIVDAILQSCDALDGTEDGLIFNVQACNFDPMALACENGNGDSCISPEKAAALKSAFAGPKDSSGYQVYPGFQFDTGIDDVGFIAGLIVGNNNAPVGPSVSTLLELDVDGIARAAMATDAALGDSTSLNLSSFVGNGGKIIFYHGVSDPWFSALDTLGYYQGMSAQNGGLESVNEWSKLYMVPGMGHCQGGDATLDSFDMLTTLVDWVESDQAPEGVVATGLSKPGVSRPLCPHPSYPTYDGSGDINNAENFACQE